MWKHPSADLGHDRNESWVVQAQCCWSLRPFTVGTAYGMFANSIKIVLHHIYVSFTKFTQHLRNLFSWVVVAAQVVHMAQLAFIECCVLPSVRTLPAVLVSARGTNLRDSVYASTNPSVIMNQNYYHHDCLWSCREQNFCSSSDGAFCWLLLSGGTMSDRLDQTGMFSQSMLWVVCRCS